MEELERLHLEQVRDINQSEFDLVYNDRRSAALMIERIINPSKYPKFHAYLDAVHELWIKDMSCSNIAT